MDSIQKAQKILYLLQEEALTQFPTFPEAFGLLELKPCSLLHAALGTDGRHLLFCAVSVCRLFCENPDELRWMYLHVHLHCILGHVNCHGNRTTGNAKLYNSLCDLTVTGLGYLLTRESVPKSMRLFLAPDAIRQIFEAEKKETLAALLKVSAGNPLVSDVIPSELSNLLSITEYFHSDSHEYWNNLEAMQLNSASAARATGSDSVSNPLNASIFSMEHLTDKLLDSVRKELSKGYGKRGTSAGSTSEEANLQKRDSLDYSSFLHRFTVPREEAMIDADSFDYIPYHYGLTYYGNLPFIEPLEYKEVNRLDELAIAIDTSGSCSGKIVRRFLEETWNILRQRESFFSKMRLHLIQCDSMIQEYRIFTSVEEWEEAIPNFQVLGLGNTDFRPVFELLEKQIRQGEIRQLRGLLYFTDGDGIFPRSEPPFDTAFVFLNQATEKHKIPDWGIRLNLNLPEDF